MAFIVEQQAQFASDIQQVIEQDDKFNRRGLPTYAG